MMIRKLTKYPKSLLLLLLFCLLSLYWHLSTFSLPSDYCPRRRHFGNLTDTHFFVFIKPKHADADVFSNLFFYLGLKYSRYFALNIEGPMAWYGLSSGFFDESFLQETEKPPRVVSQEMDYRPEKMDLLFGDKFQISNKVVVGFLRNPYEVFMSCLMSHIQWRRKQNDPTVSMTLDVNVNNYLDSYHIGGNLKSGTTYMGPQTCNNGLAHSLGLNDDLYRTQYNLQTDPGAADKFADLVERRVSDFIIYEHLLQSVFLMRERYCLNSNKDMLFLTRIPENYVSIGLGKMSPETRDRLQGFLQFDYTIYNRTVAKFQDSFAKRCSNPTFYRRYNSFQSQIVDFTNYCCRKTLSLKTEETKIRAYGMTKDGARDAQCSLINGNNVMLANMVYQIQEFQLTDRVASVLRKEEGGGSLREVAKIVNETLVEEADWENR